VSRLEIAASKADARAADAARKLGAPQVLAEIERRYSKDEGWITMAELTDPGTMRRIDALALHTYQSRGLEMVGFEIKVSRSD
jgi:hypothetical protein